MSAACWPYVGLSWPMAPTPTSFTPAPVRGLLFHTRQHQTSLQTLPHTSLMHPPPRSARLPSHPYQPHRAGHAGPSLPYVGHRLDPSWRILGRCWAHVDVFWIYVGPMLGVAGPKLAIPALCRPHVGPMLAYLGRWRQPRHPLRPHLCAGSFSTRANTKRACKLSPTHPSCIRPPGLPASPPTHISHTALAMLGLACRMLGTGWTQVGVSWADVGPMLTYFESMLGPCWA